MDTGRQTVGCVVGNLDSLAEVIDRITLRTGPKTSACANSSSGGTLSAIEGAKKLPPSQPGTIAGAPPVTKSIPRARALSAKPTTA